MSDKDKTVKLYCSQEPFEIRHLGNHLENEGIEYQITGDTDTTVLGMENPTQETCLRVFEKDYDQAKSIVEIYLKEEE